MDQPHPSSTAAFPERATGQLPWRRKGLPARGLRWQSTVAAVAVVAVALLAGGLLLLMTLESALVSGTDTLLRTKVQDVAALIHSQDAEEAGLVVASTVKKDPLVQIIDGTGKVIGASESRLLAAPLSSRRPAAGQDATATVSEPGLLGDADERYLVVLGVDDEGSRY
jgi:hypothetical protein